jgi:hypothetical protein
MGLDVLECVAYEGWNQIVCAIVVYPAVCGLLPHFGAMHCMLGSPLILCQLKV